MNPVESRPHLFLVDPKDIYIFPLPPLTGLKPDQIKELIPPLIKEWLKFRCIPSDQINPHKIASNLSLRYEDFMGLLAVGFQTRREAEISYATFGYKYFDGMVNGQVEQLLIDAKQADPKIVKRIFEEIKLELIGPSGREGRSVVRARRPHDQSEGVDVDKLKLTLDELRKEGGVSAILAKILQLRVVEGLKREETAKTLGISLELVRIWEGKAWQRVKKEEEILAAEKRARAVLG